VEVFVDVLKDTGMSFLVSDGDIEDWVPHSLVANRDDVEEGASLEITIPVWKAKEIGLV
jgi:hypothetical protein